MSDYAFFYNSENGDRKYNADSFEQWLKKFFTTGVFAGELMVQADSGMNVRVGTGYTNIEGKVKIFNAEERLTIETADPTYNRIDTVVVERNDTERDFFLKVVKGGLASEPIPTPPVRTAGIYQIVLAEVYVAAGTTSITQAMITDKRMDPSVCGYVAGTVKEIDFSQISEQFLTWESEFQATVIDWFNHLQELISEDIAVRLQLEIGELSQLQTQDKSNLVNAINEVLNSTDESIYEKVDGIIGTDEEWSRTKSYALGDMVLHNNKLWSCVLQHSGQEPPNTMYWKNVSLTDLGGLRFGIDGDGNYGYYRADGSLIPFRQFEDTIDFLGKSASTSAGTFTINVNSMSKYKIIIAYFSDNNLLSTDIDELVNRNLANSIILVTSVDNFKSKKDINTVFYSGSGSSNNITVTYSSDTVISFTRSGSINRTMYIFGIK